MRGGFLHPPSYLIYIQSFKFFASFIVIDIFKITIK